MITNVELTMDKAGNLIGVLFSELHEPIGQIEILKSESDQNASSVYRVFLNNGFIGEHKSERRAVEFVLKLAKLRDAAGILKGPRTANSLKTFGNRELV